MMAWTAQELATNWKVSPKHVYGLIKSGRLKSFSVGARKGIRISDEEKKRWEENGQGTPTETLHSPSAAEKPLRSITMKAIAAV